MPPVLCVLFPAALLRGENFYGRDKEALAGELTYDTAAHNHLVLASSSSSQLT
jgi:hypothetical protein